VACCCANEREPGLCLQNSCGSIECCMPHRSSASQLFNGRRMRIQVSARPIRIPTVDKYSSTRPDDPPPRQWIYYCTVVSASPMAQLVRAAPQRRRTAWQLLSRSPTAGRVIFTDRLTLPTHIYWPFRVPTLKPEYPSSIVHCGVWTAPCRANQLLVKFDH
jgi:hypothetical protein